MSLGSRIAEARAARRLSQTALSQAVGVTRSAVAQWELDATQPATDNLRKIADALGCDMGWLIGDHGTAPAEATAGGMREPAGDPLTLPPTLPQSRAVEAPSVGDLPRDVPVLGVAAGSELESRQSLGSDAFELNGQVVDYVRRPPGIARVRQAFCIRVVGHSMEPRYRPGALVYLDPGRPPAVGDDVVIELHHPAGEAAKPCILKEYVGKGTGLWLLQQFNPPKRLKLRADLVAKVYKVLSLQELLGL